MTLPVSPSGKISDWFGRVEVQWFLYGLVVVAFVVVAIVGRWGMVSSGLPANCPPTLPPTERRVNPNSAEWWELAALPGLGESLAKQIVDYRMQQRANVSNSEAIIFRSVRDLEAVRGIGPKKAAALESMLVFPD